MIKKTAAAETLFFLSALVSVLLTLAILGFMLYFGLPLIKDKEFINLISLTWNPGKGFYGIRPMIAGTLIISGLSVIIAFPVSLGSSFLISVLAPKAFADFFRKVIQLMTGIPTVIYGFVGVFLLVPVIRGLFQAGSGMCVLTASLMLAILIAPTMILFFTDSFDRVPLSYLQAADSLGASKVQKLLYIILPCSRSGICSGVILAMGRALGDTLIALMLAGNAVQIPATFSDSARTLTSHIALVIASDYESPEFKSLFTCGMILYGFTALEVLMLRALNMSREK